MPRKPTLLILSQVYVPDPTSLGQHMHDAAAEMARRGYRVVVYTSARGYDDPSARFPRRDTRDGVDIRRLPLSSFGKGSIKVRLAAQLLFLQQAAARGVLRRNLHTVLVSTSPPMAGAAGLAIARAHPGARLAFWAMDINPDQSVAMGATTADSALARAFDAMNRRLLKRADVVVALDRYMAATLERKAPVGGRMAVMPPWPHDEPAEPLDHADNPFRAEHGLTGKTVVMYSGNISPAHPIDTILEAADRLRDKPSLVFLFIGGKAARERIDEFAAERGLGNVRTLPYQPLDQLRYSLSAADLHLVIMGKKMVGIVHPCKVYGAMAVHRPILFVGPRDSHVGEILAADQLGWRVDHGDIDGAVAALREVLATDPAALRAMGDRAFDAMRRKYTKTVLLERFCDALEGKPDNSA